MRFHNPLWQSSQWEQFQNACGNKTFRLQNVLTIERKTAFRKTFLEIPRAEIGKLNDAFWTECAQEARKRKSIFARVFPGDSTLSPLRGDQGGPIRATIRTKNVPEIFPEHTLVIDLTKSEEEILQGMKQKGRYNIKLAREKGVEVFPSADVGAFYQLLQVTTTRDNFSAHSSEVYAKMLGSFGTDGLLLLAKYQGTIIAGGIFLCSGDVMTYYYGASADEHRNVMAPYLVQWEAIREAKKRGCKWYDFLGIAPDTEKEHRLAGVSRFKEKFGGIRVSYAPAFEVVYRRWWDGVLRGVRRIRRSI